MNTRPRSLPRGVRNLPWIVALLGLAIPLIGSSFTLWPLVLVWFVALTAAGLFGRYLPAGAVAPHRRCDHPLANPGVAELGRADGG